MMGSGRVLLAGVLALSLGGVTPAAAQRMGPPQERQQLERRVRQRFAEMIRTRLGLTDEEAQLLEQTIQGFQASRMALAREEQALRARTDALLKDPQASDEEAADVLDRLEELRLREADLIQSEQAQLLEFLSPLQVVRFHSMREQFAQRVQQLRGGPPMGPGRRPAGGPGGGPGGAGGVLDPIGMFPGA